MDLSKPLGSELKELIYEALLVYKVIFFRDQNISTEEHINFSKNFGELEIHPFAPKKRIFLKFWLLHIMKIVRAGRILGILMLLGERSLPWDLSLE